MLMDPEQVEEIRADAAPNVIEAAATPEEIRAPAAGSEITTERKREI